MAFRNPLRPASFVSNPPSQASPGHFWTETGGPRNGTRRHRLRPQADALTSCLIPDPQEQHSSEHFHNYGAIVPPSKSQLQAAISGGESFGYIPNDNCNSGRALAFA